MLIIKDRKRIEAEELFTDIQSFIEELKLSYNNLNFENINIQNLILDVYNKILNDDDIVQYCRLQQGKHYPTFFNFKYKNRNQLEFWLERGFDENYFNELTKQITENRTKKSIITYDKLKEEKQIIEEGFTINYKYKNLEFNSETIPYCNTCNSQLNMNKFVSDKLVKCVEIFGCKNENCDTNIIKGNKKLLWYSFLPEYKYNEVLNNIKKDTIFSKKYWINKGLTEEESILKISEIQSEISKKCTDHSKKGKFKENLRNKGYTEEEIKECCLAPSNVEFWQKKGFSKNKSKRKVFKNQSYAAKFVDCEKRLLPNKVDYWKNLGFSDEESVKKVSFIQTTFSREICIEKYGEEKGLEIFTNRQKLWMNSLNTNGNLKIGYSKISQELFKIINERIQGNFKYATLNGEFSLPRKNGGVWIYDFVDLDKKKIIEYNGDMYHANPNTCNENDTPHPFRKNLLSIDIWNKDIEKEKIANENGFTVLKIWDSEFRRRTQQDKELVIQKCIEFINNNENRNKTI